MAVTFPDLQVLKLVIKGAFKNAADDMLLFSSPRKQGLTFHMNCLYSS